MGCPRVFDRGRKRFWSRPRIWPLTVAVILSLASCGPSPDDGLSEWSPTTAAEGEVNDMLLRNVFIRAHAEGQGDQAVPLYFALVNHTGRGDELTSVAAPGVASAVRVPAGTLRVPAGEAVYGHPYPFAMLTGVRHRLAPGSRVVVTFTFRHAGSGRIDVPVVPPLRHWKQYSPSPSPSKS